jgi:hypothetical protein
MVALEEGFEVIRVQMKLLINCCLLQIRPQIQSESLSESGILSWSSLD